LKTKRREFQELTSCHPHNYIFNPQITIIDDIMPVVRTKNARNRKPPPDGFDDIEDTLLEFENQMKDAENESHEGKKKHEMLWPIFQITHQRRFLF
jgi:hypothetical protein